MIKHIAIVGSGQLARMVALDGIPMGFTFSFLASPTEDTICVRGLGSVITLARQTPQALFAALGEPDVITVEKEHVDIDLLTELETYCTVAPNPRALAHFKNRHSEKSFLQSLDLPIADYLTVTDRPSLDKACYSLSKPIFLKSQEEGYDGYNQYKITDENAEKVANEIEFPSNWVAESFVAFDREISFLSARNAHGEIVFYPSVENYHHNGTLLRSLAPAPNVSQAMQKQGEQYLEKILTRLDYVGFICMECFVVGEKLLINEIAPRVHNSGHWTSKGAITSQFENHVRAVSALPLGETDITCQSGMLNLLGVSLTAEQASAPRNFLTVYGKKPKPKRKLGHVTVLDRDMRALQRELARLEKIAYGEINI